MLMRELKSKKISMLYMHEIQFSGFCCPTCGMEQVLERADNEEATIAAFVSKQTRIKKNAI